MFDDADFARLFELIYASERTLAVAAADFLMGRMAIIGSTDPDRKAGRQFRSGKVWTEDMWNVFEIVKFSAESPTHSHTAYLVDSLIDVCPALKVPINIKGCSEFFPSTDEPKFRIILK